MASKLEKLWQEMADLTKPECASCKPRPFLCCHDSHCAITEAYVREEGFVIYHTGHAKLPFMGPNGCIVPPHLRPHCTLHTCDINNWGFKNPKDDPKGKWTRQYFALRDKIDEAEHQRSKGKDNEV